MKGSASYAHAADQSLWMDLLKERLCSGEIVGFSGRKHQFDWIEHRRAREFWSSVDYAIGRRLAGHFFRARPHGYLRRRSVRYLFGSS